MPTTQPDHVLPPIECLTPTGVPRSWCSREDKTPNPPEFPQGGHLFPNFGMGFGSDDAFGTSSPEILHTAADAADVPEVPVPEKPGVPEVPEEEEAPVPEVPEVLKGPSVA